MYIYNLKVNVESTARVVRYDIHAVVLTPGYIRIVMKLPDLSLAL